jgi:hypothetical protein
MRSVSEPNTFVNLGLTGSRTEPRHRRRFFRETISKHDRSASEPHSVFQVSSNVNPGLARSPTDGEGRLRRQLPL